MEYKLSVSDRIGLLGLLPSEGDFKTLKYIRKFRESLAFSEEEQKDLKFETKTDRVTWKENPEARSFDIPKVVVELIVTKLKELDMAKKLHDSHFVLYETFVEADTPEE